MANKRKHAFDSKFTEMTVFTPVLETSLQQLSLTGLSFSDVPEGPCKLA